MAHLRPLLLLFVIPVVITAVAAIRQIPRSSGYILPVPVPTGNGIDRRRPRRPPFGALERRLERTTRIEADRAPTGDTPLPLPLPLPQAAHTTTHSIQLPLRQAWSNDVRINIESILSEITDSTAYFVNPVVDATNDEAWRWSCSIPAFGDNCSLRFDLSVATTTGTPSLVLSMHSHLDLLSARANEDFGWICAKLYEQYSELDAVVDCSAQLLERVLVQHSNVDAATFAWNPSQLATFECMLHGFGKRNDKADSIRGFIDHLDTLGYAIIDHESTVHDNPAFTLQTTAAQQIQLSDYYLQEASSQGASVRTDRVHFLSRKEAQTCGVESQYDLLMGLAHFLNDHLPLTEPTSPYLQPIFPATVERPLTLPRSLQFAEYAHGDYYVAHSDNGLTNKVTPDNHPIRVNFRAYTCILYMNANDWNKENDGGALRLILNKKMSNVWSEAKELATDISVDIAPINGRLLIFDSSLVHSVEPVTSATKQRRALTLWIHKPNNSDLHG